MCFTGSVSQSFSKPRWCVWWRGHAVAAVDTALGQIRIFSWRWNCLATEGNTVRAAACDKCCLLWALGCGRKLASKQLRLASAPGDSQTCGQPSTLFSLLWMTEVSVTGPGSYFHCLAVLTFSFFYQTDPDFLLLPPDGPSPSGARVFLQFLTYLTLLIIPLHLKQIHCSFQTPLFHRLVLLCPSATPLPLSSHVLELGGLRRILGILGLGSCPGFTLKSWITLDLLWTSLCLIFIFCEVE